MKAQVTRYATRVTLFAAALLATCLFAGSANAQSWIQGKFTLPYETHWGKAVLPAGDYQFRFTPDNAGGTMLVLRNAKTLRIVAFESANIRKDSANDQSALLIGTRGERHIVQSLRIAEVGQVFVYDRELARAAEEEARQSQAVPVIVAKK
jgi:hypothetical protein